MISGFKLYWNAPKKISLYDDSKHSIWQNIDTIQDEMRIRKERIDKIIKFIKENLTN